MLACVAPVAKAAPTTPQEPATYLLAGHLVRDVVVTSTFTTTWFLTETVLKDPLSPQSCGWCQANAFDTSIRSAWKWTDTHGAAQISNVAVLASGLNAFGTLGLLAVANEHPRDLTLNSLYVLQSVSMTMTFTNIVKVLVARQRPALHFEESAAVQFSPAERNLSFFSGHSTIAFSLVSAAATVATLRGYRYTGWVWSIGLTLAAVTAYARIAADAHYATDVLVGGVVGTTIGAVIPRWLHGRSTKRIGNVRQQASVEFFVAPTKFSGALLGFHGAF